VADARDGDMSWDGLLIHPDFIRHFVLGGGGMRLALFLPTEDEDKHEEI
jgi:hypothetical protein